MDRKLFTNREMKEGDITIIEVVAKKDRMAKTMKGKRLLRAS